jgi:hypothetical protein
MIEQVIGLMPAIVQVADAASHDRQVRHGCETRGAEF